MIEGVLLAAGRSSRFGADKLGAIIDGEPAIARSVRALAALDGVVVVLAPHDNHSFQPTTPPGVRLVRNADRDSGMASSIRVGVEALHPESRAVVIALGDQPFAQPSVTTALVERWHVGDADIVVPEYTDGRSHPVLFSRACLAALRTLVGDAGARSLIESGSFRVARMPVDSAMPIDVDTPEALTRAAERAGMTWP